MSEGGDFKNCAHCSASGCCSSGANGNSCAACQKSQNLRNEAPGLVCSVCKGIGVIEPKTVRINKRIVPVLALFIVYVALGLVMVNTHSDHFSEILAFAGTLIGSITGYYFGGKSQN